MTSPLVIPSAGNSTFSGRVISIWYRPTRIVCPCAANLTLLFPHNLVGPLVKPESYEPRVPKFAFRCPLGKADFGHELRFDPMGTTARWRTSGKWADSGSQLCKLLSEALQSLGVESRAYFARVY